MMPKVGNKSNQCQSLPACVKRVLVDIDRTHDPVHRYIRLIAAYETLIKLLASVSHAAKTDAEEGPGRGYTLAFQEQFIDKSPALGDWLDILTRHRKNLSKTGPNWYATVLKQFSEKSFSKNDPATSFCKAVERARQSMLAESTVKSSKCEDILSKFAALRNMTAHGSTTIRQARKFEHVMLNA